jgi:hypothetical protein
LRLDAPKHHHLNEFDGLPSGPSLFHLDEVSHDEQTGPKLGTGDEQLWDFLQASFSRHVQYPSSPRPAFYKCYQVARITPRPRHMHITAHCSQPQKYLNIRLLIPF